jgi:tetratricopeptide (TPR) repeat protein
MRAVVVAIVLGICAPAHADPRKPLDPETRTKASGHVKQAQEFFKTEQWDKALAEYSAALELTGEPVLVFDIALVHDKAGHPEEALAGYKRYLELEPTGQVAGEAREDVARLVPIVEQILERKRQGDADRARAEAQRHELARRRAMRDEQLGRAEDIDARASGYRWTAIGLGGAALVTLGIGVKFGLDARSASNELSAFTGPMWTPELLQRDADGRSAQKKMTVATSIGAAVAVSAGVLYLLSRRAHGRAERVRVDAGGLVVAF